MHHLLLIDIDLPVVAKILSQNLSQLITYNFVNEKSKMTGIRLEKLSFANAGYYFFSPVNNMGVMFWIILFFLLLISVFVIIRVYILIVYIWYGSKPRCSQTHILYNIFDSMRSLFATNQVVLITCVMLYFKYETTYLSETIVSGT